MSIWLVRIAIDLRNKSAWQDMRDITALHRRVMSLLPDQIGPQPRQQAGVLFRVDHTRNGPVILVQTAMEPDVSRLPVNYGKVDVRDLTPLLKALYPGMRVRYRIAANPSKRVWKGENAGKIVPLSGVAAEDWWRRKAQEHGLDLEFLHAAPQPAAEGRIKPVRHAIVRFDGQAVVQSVDQVQAAIRTGIGRGKSFGCGLLSLAPMR